MSKKSKTVTVRMNYAVRVPEEGGSTREYSTGFEYVVSPTLAQEWVDKGSAVVVAEAPFQEGGLLPAPEEQAPKVPAARKVASKDQ